VQLLYRLKNTGVMFKRKGHKILVGVSIIKNENLETKAYHYYF
jgi:hypothetical protein